jgi:predicted transcriptional regulator
MNAVVSLTIRDKLHALADQLPANATWDDVREEVVFWESVERGLADAKAGRVVAHADVRKCFGLDE